MNHQIYEKSCRKCNLSIIQFQPNKLNKVRNFLHLLQDTLRRIISRRDERRLSGDLSASMGANAKLTYSALIRKSSKNHYINSNNSFSSGIYVDGLPDLSKRPLVVSFKKHKAENNVNNSHSGGRNSLCDMKHEHFYKNDLELEYIMKDRRDSVEETFCESEFTVAGPYDTTNLPSVNMVHCLRRGQAEEKRHKTATSEDVECQRQKKLSKIRNLFRQCKNKRGQSYSCTNSSEVQDKCCQDQNGGVRKSSSVPCFSDKS